MVHARRSSRARRTRSSVSVLLRVFSPPSLLSGGRRPRSRRPHVTYSGLQNHPAMLISSSQKMARKAADRTMGTRFSQRTVRSKRVGWGRRTVRMVARARRAGLPQETFLCLHRKYFFSQQADFRKKALERPLSIWHLKAGEERWKENLMSRQRKRW